MATLQMANPWKHPVTGRLYFRARVPKDLIEQLRGREVVVEVDGKPSTVKLGDECKVSLHTSASHLAKARYSQVQAQVHELWEAARKGTQHFNDVQLSSLARELYLETVDDDGNKPGEPGDLDHLINQLADALRHFDRDDEERFNPRQGEVEILGLTSIGRFLERRGLSLTPAGNRRFAFLGGDAVYRAYRRLARVALGDRSPDKNIHRFAPPDASQAKVPLFDLFDGWVREAAPSARTAREWRPYLEDFVRLIGHDDAARFTGRDISEWKDALIKRNNSVKTINDSKLAALSRVLQWGVQNHKLEKNAASHVKYRQKKQPGTGMRNFSPAEAAAIFEAAGREKSEVYRWVPALMALSGARVAEVCQLRGKDVRQQDGIWVMHITDEAGSVKNASSVRHVPLHPYLLDRGFVEFVRQKGDGPLFHPAVRRKKDATTAPARIVAKNLAAWARGLDLQIGREHRKDPNHGWRHYVTALMDEHDISRKVQHEIVGHAPGDVHERYGQVRLDVVANAIRKLPTPTEFAAKLKAAKDVVAGAHLTGN